MCYCPTPTLHLNLALTGDGAFLFSLKKTHSVWFISVLNYGDTENVLINHLLLVIPMSYTTHTHTTHTHPHTHTHHPHTHTRSTLGTLLKVTNMHHLGIYVHFKYLDTHPLEVNKVQKCTFSKGTPTDSLWTLFREFTDTWSEFCPTLMCER